jgi:hypothetical protein
MTTLSTAKLWTVQVSYSYASYLKAVSPFVPILTVMGKRSAEKPAERQLRRRLAADKNVKFEPRRFDPGVSIEEMVEKAVIKLGTLVLLRNSPHCKT